MTTTVHNNDMTDRLVTLRTALMQPVEVPPGASGVVTLAVPPAPTRDYLGTVAEACQTFLAAYARQGTDQDGDAGEGDTVAL